MKKIYAWTLAEMVVAITVLIILSGVAMTVLKPNNQKTKIFVYATLRNLERANAALMDKYEELNQAKVGGNDWYCLQLADMFTLKGTADCTAKDSSTIVNMTLPNDVTLIGISNNWRSPYTGSEFVIKDIGFDINGAAAPNKVWVDRFPLRVYSGDAFTGVIRPVNCQSDQVYNKDTGAASTLSPKHPLCDSTNYLSDDTVISFDILKAEITGEEDEEGLTTATTKTVRMGLSALASDCLAYGGEGVYSRAQCAAGGFKLLDDCINSETCKSCSKDANNTCPASYATTDACENRANAVNPDDLPCTVITHKVGAAVSGLLGNILDEVDM